jgi:putative ABC transport system substrate-binding protein
VLRARTVFFVALLAWLASARAADLVAVVLSEPGGAYGEVAAALRSELPADVVVREFADVPPADAKPRLIVAVGTKACAALPRAPGAPVLCTLIPRAAFERIVGEAGGRNRNLSALFLDQPPARQIALVRLLLPKAESLAMLFGRESAPAEIALAAAAARQGLRPAIAKAAGPDELYPALQGLLEGGADALLAVPDSRIYNAGTVQNILRASIRARVPLVAFSPAYVRAGALAAVHSTPQQAGRQAGQLAREVLAGRPLPAPLTPAEFTVTVNAVVARSFGLELPEGDALAARLRTLEKTQ